MTIILAARTLTGLVDTARTLSARAREAGDFRTAFGLLNIALTLDAARTRLIEEEFDYLEEAWTHIRAGRVLVTDYKLRMAEKGPAVTAEQLVDRPLRWSVEEAAAMPGYWCAYTAAEFHLFPTWREAVDRAFARAAGR